MPRRLQALAHSLSFSSMPPCPRRPLTSMASSSGKLVCGRRAPGQEVESGPVGQSGAPGEFGAGNVRNLGVETLLVGGCNLDGNGFHVGIILLRLLRVLGWNHEGMDKKFHFARPDSVGLVPHLVKPSFSRSRQAALPFPDTGKLLSDPVVARLDSLVQTRPCRRQFRRLVIETARHESHAVVQVIDDSFPVGLHHAAGDNILREFFGFLYQGSRRESQWFRTRGEIASPFEQKQVFDGRFLYGAVPGLPQADQPRFDQSGFGKSAFRRLSKRGCFRDCLTPLRLFYRNQSHVEQVRLSGVRVDEHCALQPFVPEASHHRG